VPELLNLTTGEHEAAEVVRPIQGTDIDDFVTHWLPPVSARIEELKKRGPLTREILSDNNLEDAHWEWPAKWRDRITLEWSSFAVRCGGHSQGLMFVHLLRRCRLPSQVNQHLVYIDLLSTAPWNRPRLCPDPVYRGVGVVLLTEAILLSKDEGFEGRLGLHALPGAVDFYGKKCGMDSLGNDPGYHSLPYFEMTAEQAASFMET
jgi:hypothetical protein